MNALLWFLLAVFVLVIIGAAFFLAGLLVFAGRALSDDTHHQGSMDEHQ